MIFNSTVNLFDLQKYAVDYPRYIKELNARGVIINMPELNQPPSGIAKIVTFGYKPTKLDEATEKAMDDFAWATNSTWHEGCLHKLNHVEYINSGGIFEIVKCSRCNESFSKKLREL